MQNTTHYNLKKPDYTDFADVFDINDNMDTIDGKLAAPDGDGRDQTVSFTDADLDSGITSFPTFLTKIVSGMKMAKFIRDFKAGMAYVLHTGSLINNATCTESGKALDARMGKTLQDQITSLNDSITQVQTVAQNDFFSSTNPDLTISSFNCVASNVCLSVYLNVIYTGADLRGALIGNIVSAYVPKGAAVVALLARDVDAITHASYAVVITNTNMLRFAAVALDQQYPSEHRIEISGFYII